MAYMRRGHWTGMTFPVLYAVFLDIGIFMELASDVGDRRVYDDELVI
jgi:hypothetical protein